MTSTDMTPPPATPSVRRLRRSRTDRVGAGVAGGLGDYFGVDPVLFRVLFATAAFFGGAGVLAYLLAWAAIPEEGTERAAIDGWAATLRRHRIPFWVVLAAAAFLLWLIAFSWWAPGPFVPVIVVVIILVALLGRRARHEPAAPSISLVKNEPTTPQTPGASAPIAPASTTSPAWADDTRRWLQDARAARRARLRRAWPVTIATLVSFVVAMVVLGLVDAAHHISLATYFWFALAILGSGLLIGLVLRRASWGIALLLVPVVVGTIAFAGTQASLADGIGQKQWQPTTRPASHYALAFGQGELDLRSMAPLRAPSHVRIDVAAGQVRILAPATLNLRVIANARFGDIEVDGNDIARSGHHWDGVGISRVVAAPPTASGPPMIVDVHLSSGNIDVEHSVAPVG
jgi:phage shock protein PspC (stress-responsive transcriptional regulator)